MEMTKNQIFKLNLKIKDLSFKGEGKVEDVEKKKFKTL